MTAIDQESRPYIQLVELSGCFTVLFVSLNDFYSSYLWSSEVVLLSKPASVSHG